jgi:DNA-binding MarR family transcriptional regulator
VFEIKTYGGFLISQIRQIGNRAFDKILRDSGIDAFNGPQGRILYVLWEHENLSITDIAKLTSLANTTLTGMLDRMESQGLIMRVPDKGNRRKIIIKTTSEAEKLKTAYKNVSEKTNEIFYNGFTEDEVVFFEDTLRRILKNFEERESNEK